MSNYRISCKSGSSVPVIHTNDGTSGGEISNNANVLQSEHVDGIPIVQRDVVVAASVSFESIKHRSPDSQAISEFNEFLDDLAKKYNTKEQKNRDVELFFGKGEGQGRHLDGIRPDVAIDSLRNLSSFLDGKIKKLSPEIQKKNADINTFTEFLYTDPRDNYGTP